MKSDLFDIKLRLGWVILIVAVIVAAAVFLTIQLSKNETVLENHVYSLEKQKSLIEQADDYITAYYDKILKECIDNHENVEKAVSKISFEVLDKKRDEMASAYVVDSPEYQNFIRQFDMKVHQYFLEFKEILNDNSKSK
ncbi:MAG: hypothetical protein IK004_01940 [Bacteroidales bacterium]|nr:hypothetical protein [Bacteroidales bacterium]